MNPLRARLEALEETLREVGSPLVPHLRPGADPRAVESALISRGIEPHPDVVTWFGWHDGTDLPSATDPPGAMLPSDGNRLIYYLHFPGLDQALVEHDLAVALERENNPDPAHPPLLYWPGWFPVTTSSVVLCVDTLGTVGPIGTVFVHDVWTTDNPPPPFFSSLEALVNAVIDTYATGQVSPTQLAVDPAVLPPTAQALNY